MSQLFIPDSSYQWQMIVFDASDSLQSDDVFTFTMPFALGADLAASTPTAFALHQNYPNPFNPVKTMRFDIPADTKGSLIVYDLMGREVATLLDAYFGGIPLRNMERQRQMRAKQARVSNCLSK